MESPLQERMWLVCLADMARTFEYVLHFVRCVTVTVTLNQIIILLLLLLLFVKFDSITFLNIHFSLATGTFMITFSIKEHLQCLFYFYITLQMIYYIINQVITGIFIEIK